MLTLLFCFLGARLGYAAEQAAFFTARPLEILAVYQGGLSAGGALFGWMAGLCVAAALFRLHPLRLADALFPLAAPLTVSAWLAAWLAGSAYGPLSAPAGSWGLPALDESGQTALRWPLQLAAASALLAFYIALEKLSQQPRPAGWLASLAGAGCAAVMLAAAMLRADPLPPARLDRIEAQALLGFLLGLFTLIALIARVKFKSGKTA